MVSSDPKNRMQDRFGWQSLRGRLSHWKVIYSEDLPYREEIVFIHTWYRFYTNSWAFFIYSQSHEPGFRRKIHKDFKFSFRGSFYQKGAMGSQSRTRLRWLSSSSSSSFAALFNYFPSICPLLMIIIFFGIKPRHWSCICLYNELINYFPKRKKTRRNLAL